MADWVVDTWTWGTTSITDQFDYASDLTVNESAPGDFDPSSVTNVALSVVNVAGSGFGGAGDDIWHEGAAALGDQTVGLFTSGGTSLATNVGTVASNQAGADQQNITKDTVSTTGSGGTINTTASTTDWEGAKLRLSGTFATTIQWAEIDKTKGWDGVTLTGGSVTLTITYTPGGTDATITPTAVAGTTTVGTATFTSDASHTATAVAGTTQVDTPTTTAGTGTTISATSVTGTTTADTPTVTSDADITATSVTGVASVDTPTVTGEASAEITATAVTGTATIPGPSSIAHTTTIAEVALGSMGDPATDENHTIGIIAQIGRASCRERV